MVVAGLAFYAITLLLDMCELTGFKVRYFGKVRNEIGKFDPESENLISNFDWYSPTYMETFQLLVFSNCPFQLHVSRYY